MSEKVELIKERDKLFIRSQHLAQDKETLQKENQELKLRNSYLEQLEKSITEDVKKAAFKNFEEGRGQTLVNYMVELEEENKALKGFKEKVNNELRLWKLESCDRDSSEKALSNIEDMILNWGQGNE